MVPNLFIGDAMNLRERYKYDRVVQELLDQVGYDGMLKNRLKYWRHQKQMEKVEFAAWLEVNPNQYSRWENQRIQPNLETAWKLAKKLGIKVDDLFEEVE